MTKAEKIWIKAMDYGGRMGCHQMPERSFFFKGYQFPVCARCTGVFLGEVIAVIGLVAGRRLRWPWIVTFAGIMGADWGIQRLGICPSTNRRRLVTGTLCGIGLTYAYFYALAGLIKTCGFSQKND